MIKILEGINKYTLINNSRIITELKSALYSEYNQAREGIHVSDLNLCMRETVFRRIDPKPISDRELGLFSVGRAVHESLQQLAKTFPHYEIEKEVNYQIFGDGRITTINAHIDLYDTKRNIPIEAKTIRKNRLGVFDKQTKTWSQEEPKPFHVEQLQMYMTLVNADIGYIIYQLLLDYDNFPFKVFEVAMTKEERRALLEKMVDDALHLQKNIDLKTPENTRHIALNPDKNWKCTYCRYMGSCYEMRMLLNQNGKNDKFQR